MWLLTWKAKKFNLRSYDAVIIPPEQAQRCLPAIKTGVVRYLEIMKQVHSTNVSNDRNFQRLYNAFYRMRQRPAEYYDCYFSFLEEKKHFKTDFSEILHHLHKQTGRFGSEREGKNTSR